MKIKFLMKIVNFVVIQSIIFCYGVSGSISQPNLINSKQNGLSPVIFIPGLGGNRLHAKLDKLSVPHRWCRKQCDYCDIWLNLFEMLPNSIDCWIDNMKLHYDNVTRKTRNTYGVEIRLPEFGRTEAIEWLDTTPIVDHFDSGAYYYHLAYALTNRGYVRGKNLFGAPYDFRKGPNENEDWFERLAQLTEYAYETNNNVGVTYVVHSMGGRMLLYFLQNMSKEWKDRFVKQMISVSVPYGGSVQAVVALTVGDTLNSKFLNNVKMKSVQETFPSIVWLMPSQYFWKSDETLAILQDKNYTIENIDAFFNDINMPNIVEIRKDLSGYNDVTSPGVDVHCLFGSSVDTVEMLNFGEKYNSKPELIRGNGDGVVNDRSLNGCKYWINTTAQGKHKIYWKDFPGAQHITILNDKGLINYILNKLTGYHDYPRADEQKHLKNI
ncbi:group XV phospholipase A2-like [Contarinia nasturtii]|uniref:group XV phospholipase A2-like n=1 Tax=Contarinia nasturtii TaxID=265458 RepID=UPI0012D3AB73|nr:group XV phospholipase A2-like [Contarinia nasturtii]